MTFACWPASSEWIQPARLCGYARTSTPTNPYPRDQPPCYRSFSADDPETPAPSSEAVQGQAGEGQHGRLPQAAAALQLDGHPDADDAAARAGGGAAGRCRGCLAPVRL